MEPEVPFTATGPHLRVGGLFLGLLDTVLSVLNGSGLAKVSGRSCSSAGD